MKCLACDIILDDFESTRKYANSGEPVDLCDSCFESIASEVPVIIRKDLLPTGFSVDDGDDNNEDYGDIEDEL